MQMHVGPRLSVVVLVFESESHGGGESIGQLSRTGKTGFPSLVPMMLTENPSTLSSPATWL